jgi:hypothetical protein
MNTINTINTTPNNDYFRYGMFFLIYSVVLSGTILFFNYADISKVFSYSTLGIVLLVFLSLGIAAYYYAPSTRGKTSSTTMVYVVAGLICFASGISGFFAYATPDQIQQFGIAALIFTCVTVVILLALFFYIFGSYLKQQRGVLGFIVNFVFFIPCMVLDTIEYFKNEFNLTTRTEFILFFLELFLLIFYFFIYPKLITWLGSQGTYILHNPVLLNTQTTALIETSSLANKQGDGTMIMSPNFSISMWVYLNVQTNNFISPTGRESESTIFSYGKGKPKITYTNSTIDNKNRDMYMFYFTDSAKQPNYKMSLPSQKWNNIVFNYHGSIVDLYINGVLQNSFVFDSMNTMPEFLTTDTIIVGQHSGLNGAICNITYSKYILENYQIVSDYNMLMFKNPPIL